MKLTLQELPTTTTPPVLRPLGSSEEFLWLYDQHRPVHFALAAQVKGSTSIGRWCVALDSVQQRHPLLSVCIQPHDGVPHFTQQPAAPIPIRVVQGKDVTQKWEQEIEQELSVPFNPNQAPLVRTILLHEPEKAVFIFLVHHSIADGLSIAFIIRDILQVLSGGSVRSLPVIPSHEDLLGMTGNKKRKVAPIETSDQRPGKPGTFVDEKKMRPRVTSLQLSPKLTEELRNRARRERTTVHGALSIAFAMAYRQIYPEVREEPVRILSPIDTRKLLNLGEDCSFLVASGIVAVEPHEAAVFWEMARSAMANLAEAQTMDGIIASKNPIHEAMKDRPDIPTVAAMGVQGFAHEVMLTNLGNLPYETRFGELTLDAVYGPAASARIEKGETIGVVSANGPLCLIQTSFDPKNSLLNVAEEILRSACAN